MLRILLTNNHLVQPGGSETWTLTVATELVRRGHEAVVFAPESGPFAETFPCPVVDAETLAGLGTFDLALVNHNSTFSAARAVAPTLIMTCHGTYPPLEQPVPRADAYVAISEEVQSHMGDMGYPATVIRNPIDCSVFAPTSPIRPSIERVLSLCQGEPANQLLAQVCERQDWSLRTIANEKRELGIERLLNDADLVVGLGRSAMEAMACGRAVLVLDSRSYTPYAMDGLVTPDNVWSLLRCNMSGRRLCLEATVDTVEAQLAGYDAALGEFGHEFARATFDVNQQVDAYLELAQGIETGRG